MVGLICLTTLVLGCGREDVKSVSQLKMVDSRLGEGPWLVVTYDGQKVTRDTVALDNGEVVVRSASVYVNKESQFILRDGTPIRIFTGDNIFWNADGYVITAKLQKVPEDFVFSVNGGPMKKNTAMTLHEYSHVRNDTF